MYFLTPQDNLLGKELASPRAKLYISVQVRERWEGPGGGWATPTPTATSHSLLTLERGYVTTLTVPEVHVVARRRGAGKRPAGVDLSYYFTPNYRGDAGGHLGEGWERCPAVGGFSCGLRGLSVEVVPRLHPSLPRGLISESPLHTSNPRTSWAL